MFPNEMAFEDIVIVQRFRRRVGMKMLCEWKTNLGSLSVIVELLKGAIEWVADILSIHLCTGSASVLGSYLTSLEIYIGPMS